MFPNESNDAIYYWLESKLPWQHTQTSFYEQFEFSLKDAMPPAGIEFLASLQTLKAIGDWLEQSFDSASLEPVDVVAHCLFPGHKMGIHNDYLPKGETHRLLLQLGRNIDGGETLLFGQMDPRALSRIVRPVYGTALAFSITPRSFHAVGKVQRGQRFTIIYSFRCRR